MAGSRGSARTREKGSLRVTVTVIFYSHSSAQHVTGCVFVGVSEVQDLQEMREPQQHWSRRSSGPVLVVTGRREAAAACTAARTDSTARPQLAMQGMETRMTHCRVCSTLVAPAIVAEGPAMKGPRAGGSTDLTRPADSSPSVTAPWMKGPGATPRLDRPLVERNWLRGSDPACRVPTPADVHNI